MEKKKKKLSENTAAAVAILIAAAVLAVPLLGGLRLSVAYRSLEKRFSNAVAVPDRHGNDLFSDTDKLIISAESLLAEGERITRANASPTLIERADRLRSAIDACRSAKHAAARYLTCEDLVSEARQYYNMLRGSATEALTTFLADIDSQSTRIERVYRLAYSNFRQSREELIKGFPAVQLAQLFRIGG